MNTETIARPDLARTMHSIIQRIATGPELSKDISREEARLGMRAILENAVDPVQAGIYLIALRMKRETLDEFKGVLDAILEATQRVTAEVDELVDIADPYDGYNRCLPAAPKQADQNAACRLQPVYFDFNESVLSTDATNAIDANAACMKQVGRPAQLIGRSDPRGTEEYNLALSERRALSVRDRLRRLGIDDNKLRTLPRGELEAKGNDEAGWAQDRRVDFEWL